MILLERNNAWLSLEHLHIDHKRKELSLTNGEKKGRSGETIELDEIDTVERDEPTLITIGNERLTKSDLDILEDRGKWLNCKLVNVGVLMLRKQFPNMHGLYDVTLGSTLSFPSQKEPFVQILNCSQCHWICVSSIGCKQNSVKVCDSLLTKEISTSVQESIAVLLSSSSKTIHIIYPDVQQQSDNSSCGLYALAFAYMLCEGKDPASFTYDEMGFRSHYLKCIKQLKIESFMCKKALYHSQQPKSSKFKIYCVCHLPDTGDEMIYCMACKEWFHYTCVELEPGIKVKGKWLCSRCTVINTALI